VLNFLVLLEFFQDTNIKSSLFQLTKEVEFPQKIFLNIFQKIYTFKDQGEWYINFLFALLDKSASPLSFLTRRLMENSTSFNDAVNMLAASDLIAPAYFILGGTEPDDGIVITRDQDSAINLWKLDTKNSIWYLLETKYQFFA
jgi:hypothetical protein